MVMIVPCFASKTDRKPLCAFTNYFFSFGAALHAHPNFLSCFGLGQLFGIGLMPSFLALGTLWIRAQLAN